MRIHRLLADGLAVTAAVILSDSATAAAGPAVRDQARRELR